MIDGWPPAARSNEATARVGLMKDQRPMFAVRPTQHKAQLRFVGQAEKLDERVPDIQLRVSDSKSPVEPPVRVLAQDRGLPGQIRITESEGEPKRTRQRRASWDNTVSRRWMLERAARRLLKFRAPSTATKCKRLRRRRRTNSCAIPALPAHCAR